MLKSVAAFICLALLCCGSILCGEASPPAEHNASPPQNGFIPLPDDPNDDCTLDKLTNGCQLFSPDGPSYIPVGEDSVIPNMSALGKPPPEKVLAAAKKDFEQRVKEAGYVQREQLNRFEVTASKILARVSGGDDGPDEHFTRYLSDHLDDMTAIVLLNPQEEEVKQVPLPWPPDSPQGVVEVPVDTARGYVLDLFSDWPEGLAKMRELVDDAHEATVDFNNILRGKPSLPVNEDSQALKEMAPERRQKVEQLVAFTRKAIVNSILDGRKYTELSEEEHAAIRKVETVTLSSKSMEKMKDDPNCVDGEPNAFYEPHTHTLSLCPELYNLPDSAIVSIVGHEIGHTIDPCESQFAAYTIDRDRLKKVQKSLSADIKDRGHLKLAEELDDSGSDSTALPAPFSGISATDVADFEKAGVLKLEASGIPSRRYILSDVYHCLSLPEGGGFQGFNLAKAEHTAERVAAFRCERTPWLSFDSEKKRLVDLLQKYPDCDLTTFRQKIDEATADWLGASATSQFLGQHDYKLPNADTPAGRLAPLSFFAALACMERNQVTSRTEQNYADAIDYIHRDLDIARDDHASTARRLTYIFLYNPGIRKAMGCRPSPLTFCDHEAPSGHGRAPANPLEKKP